MNLKYAGMTKSGVRSTIRDIKYNETLEDDLENYDPVEFAKTYKVKPNKIKKVKIVINKEKNKGYCWDCEYLNTGDCYMEIDENYNPIMMCYSKSLR